MCILIFYFGSPMKTWASVENVTHFFVAHALYLQNSEVIAVFSATHGGGDKSSEYVG